MTSETLLITVGRDSKGWCYRFADALEKKVRSGANLRYEIVDLDTNDWLDLVHESDVVLWNPASYMGPKMAAVLKEKVYFLEHHLDKLVVPNYATVWHFESKAAQSYLFRLYGVPRPLTVVSHSRDDARALLGRTPLPVVFKESSGASSARVELVSRRRAACRVLDRIFAQDEWDGAKSRLASGRLPSVGVLTAPWFWEKLRRKVTSDEGYRGAYWQEFVAGHDADLRIVVTGDRYALGFWRHNRPGDFRASGSGLLDYERPIPEKPLRYCLRFSHEQGFDSMAYDVLTRGDAFQVLEMSYNYIDTAAHGVKGYYELMDDGSLEFRSVAIWPQDLWVEWAVRKAAALGGHGDSAGAPGE